MLLTAINDQRLNGECLVKPFRSCLTFLRNQYHASPQDSSLLSQITHVASKALTLSVGAIAMVPASFIAGCGIVSKWIDLGIKWDMLVYKGAAITYSLPLPLEVFSRLGDRLVAYLHAKYVAEKFELPVYFTPFKGAEFFAFSAQEQFTSAQPHYFKKVVHLKSAKEIDAIDRTQSVLYVLPFFPDSPIERGAPCYKELDYPIDWNTFKPRVKELLQVVKPHHLLDIPAGSFSIALHVRTGGTYDRADTSTMLPGKIPPRSYYWEELKKILESSHIPQDKPIFIHIFTDDISPENIHDQIRAQIPYDDRITWSYTAAPELIDDIANMTRFDCLIRPDSNLSGTLAKAAEHLSVEVFPLHFRVNAAWTKIAIDKVGTKVHGTTTQRTTHYTFPVVKRLPEFFYRWFHARYMNRTPASA